MFDEAPRIGSDSSLEDSSFGHPVHTSAKVEMERMSRNIKRSLDSLARADIDAMVGYLTVVRSSIDQLLLRLGNIS